MLKQSCVAVLKQCRILDKMWFRKCQEQKLRQSAKR